MEYSKKVEVVCVISLFLIVAAVPLVHSNFLPLSQKNIIFSKVKKSTEITSITIYNYDGDSYEKVTKELLWDEFEDLIESIEQIQHTNKSLREKIELQLLLLKEKNLISKDITYISMWNNFNKTLGNRNNVFHLGIFDNFLFFDDILTNNATALNFLTVSNSFSPGLRFIILDRLPKLRLDICGFLFGYIHCVETDGFQGHKSMESNLWVPPRYIYVGFGRYVGFVGIVFFGESDLNDFTFHLGIGFSGFTLWKGKKIDKPE